jgi:hypothetical protein
MRLGQLSRKLNISTSEIINFLASKNIAIGEDSNTKLEDAHAHWITEKFAPHLVEAVDASISEENVVTEITEKSPIQVPSQTQAIIEGTSQEVASMDEPTLPEVIKVPKIELSGLKVLGKIELPEKKKKETTTVSTESPTEGTEQLPSPEPRPATKREWAERPRKNPIALQREREEREAEKKRKDKLLREKEKKTYAYLNRVKTQAPTKKSRAIEEQLEQVYTRPEDQPKTWWGKFTKWLRT